VDTNLPQIVEASRRGSSICQHVITAVGRKDEIIADGTLHNLLAPSSGWSSE
jgi:hypothetical protein